MAKKREKPNDDPEVRLVRNDKGDAELSAWDPDSGDTERTFNEDEPDGQHPDSGLFPDLLGYDEVADFDELGDNGGDEPLLGGDADDLDKYTASESFVGTGAIAFAPSVMPIDRARRSPKRRKHPRESPMADRRRRLAEDGSWFKEGPVRGDHQMDSPGGEGVAKKSATRETMNSSQDTKFKQWGDEWPRKHKGNLAMGTPEDHGQGGDHRSEAGDPDDGWLDPTGHDWPDEPKNSGQGVAEPFDRTLEGTEMPKGTPSKGFGAGETASESWSMHNITAMMEQDSLGANELQVLFNAFARETEIVCVENFSQLCRAYGAQNVLDEQTLMHLMEANPEFVFHEMADSNGVFWVPRPPLSEEVPAAFKDHQFKKGSDADGDGKKGEKSKKPWENGDSDDDSDDDDDDDDSGKPWESKNQRRAPISEARRGETKTTVPNKSKKGKSSKPPEMPAAFKKKAGKAKKDVKGKKAKPAFLQGESRDPNYRCKHWLETANEIRNLVREGHVTAGHATRALQASFNIQLSENHLRRCSRPVLESVKRVVDYYGLSMDRNLQAAKRLWEGRYGMGPGMEADGLEGPFDGPTSPMPGVGSRQDQMDYEPDQFGDEPSLPDHLRGGEEDPMLDFDNDDHDGPPLGGAGVPPELPEDDLQGGEFGGEMDQFPDPASLGGMGDEGAGDGFDEFNPVAPGEGDLPDVNGYTDDDGMSTTDDEYDPGFDPSPRGDTWGSRAGGTYSGNSVDNAMDHYREHGPSTGAMPGRGLAGGLGRPKAPGGWQEGRGRNRRPINEDESWFKDGATRTADGHMMDQAGSPVGDSRGDGESSGLYPEEDADMEEVAGENLLGHDQDNTGDGQVEFTHGGEGTMRNGTGPKGSAPEPKAGIKENLKRINVHVRRRLQECSGRMPAGKYSLKFSAVVAGDNRKVHYAPPRSNLAEAVADAEELLLMYGRQRVMIETAFVRKGKTAHRERIALPSVQPRGPFVTEGRACFRFPKHAEQFAKELLREGASCRVVDHNWGTAVEAKVPARVARSAFAAILK